MVASANSVLWVLEMKSRGLLILIKLTLVSDEGVYLIVAPPKAICYGRRDGTTRRMRARHPTRNRVYTLAAPRGIEIRIKTKQTNITLAPGPGLITEN